MGIIYNYSDDNVEQETKIKEELCNKKGPSFYLNKDFPNYKKIPLEDVIQNLLKSKYDLLENNQLTASLSKQFKLLYQQKSDINSNNNISDFSFSKIDFDENNNTKNNIQININKEQDSNNKNINEIKLALLNNNDNDKSLVKEIYKGQDKNINKYKNNFYISDYNIYSSAKNSSKSNNNENINSNNINIKNEIDEENKIKFIERKSSKSLANKLHEAKPHVKKRKYTDLESNIIQAASLLKDIRKEYRFKNK